MRFALLHCFFSNRKVRQLLLTKWAGCFFFWIQSYHPPSFAGIEKAWSKLIKKRQNSVNLNLIFFYLRFESFLAMGFSGAFPEFQLWDTLPDKAWVDLIKPFWHKFTVAFYNLDHFINVTIIFLYCEKI